MYVWANSSRKSATRSPIAQRSPGAGGMSTGNDPMISATAFACSGPAPPYATSAKSRGSCPRWTETSRRAPAMFSFTIAMIPSAASSAEERPIASAILWTDVARRFDVERHLAAEQLRREVAEHDIRVGHGRLFAAAPVGGRSGVGPCRLRADAECLRELRDVGDRAASCADGVHVDRRHLDAEVADRGLAADRRLTVLTEGNVRRRAAHVEGEDVLEPRLARDVERAGDAAGWAGQDPVDRVLCGLARRHQAGVRAENVDVGRGTDAGELRLQVLDVARDLGPHV